MGDTVFRLKILLEVAKQPSERRLRQTVQLSVVDTYMLGRS